MTIASILLPVFAEVLLIFVLFAAMAKSRQDAMKSGVRESDIALGTQAFPVKTRQISNAYANSFEMPTLFFVAVLFGVVLHQAGTLFVVVEWLFVIARVGQAYVHTTSNKVSIRGICFLGSVVTTVVLWLILALGVLFGIQ